ncbi:MAG: nitroreductase [Leptolinea sp.]|jgi:FMN reductase (NADPH)/FMN reductase [NAD(P)H]|nr:nitroreductase [Leptolinea sp.]
MNDILRTIHERRSTRAFENKPVPYDVTETLLQAALRAPTAGNMMLYTILKIDDPEMKEKLAVSCDNQPFIAKAPLLLVFLADYQRWYDFFLRSGAAELCQARGIELRKPGVGDLMLAVNDTLIAAQTTVIAAEALGLGSCYVGDIMEKYEYHRDLFHLPKYVLPITMLCLGYPREEAAERTPSRRFDQKFIVQHNRYYHLEGLELDMMFKDSRRPKLTEGAANFGQDFYLRKFASEFSVEMTRSVQAMLDSWNA